MVPKIIGLLVLCFFVFVLLGCWRHTQHDMCTKKENEDIETFQIREDFSWDSLVQDSKAILDDVDNVADNDTPPKDSARQSNNHKTVSHSQKTSNSQRQKQGANHTRSEHSGKQHLPTQQEAKDTYHDSLVKKVSLQKQHYANAKHHQQKESSLQRTIEQTKRLINHHTQLSAENNRLSKKFQQKVNYHKKMKDSLVSKPSPAHATHQRANAHDWKQHDVKEKMHTSSMMHHSKQAHKNAEKARHYVSVNNAHKTQLAYHTKQKKQHLETGHDTGHSAYPDHYTHHHPGYYNEWDVLHDRDERIRRAQDMRNSEPFALDEIDPEHNSGFILEQPTTYDSVVPHTHLQQYGHYTYPKSVWSTPQTDSPVCLPAVEMARKPIHLGNTYATPEDDFSVGYLMPRFKYQEYRDY